MRRPPQSLTAVDGQSVYIYIYTDPMQDISCERESFTFAICVRAEEAEIHTHGAAHAKQFASR